MPTAGSALELKNEVHRLMNQEGRPPPMLPKTILQLKGLIDLLRVLRVFDQMIKCFMMVTPHT